MPKSVPKFVQRSDSGCVFGTHRVLKPAGVLPQQAQVLDASLPIYDNEILIEVDALNIDSASFHQIRTAEKDDLKKIEKHFFNLIESRGKQHNPVTGSGGMLIGTVKEIGEKSSHRKAIKVGDRIATLVSLTLTPLKINKIKKIYLDNDRLDVDGHAILFDTGIFAKLPKDIPETTALAVLDVCGAPAQTEKLCKKGNTVVFVGGAGKSGILSAYIAKKQVGAKGRVIALDYSKQNIELLKKFSFIDEAHICDARNAVETYRLVEKITGGKMADVVINVANIPDTEMSCIMSCKPKGIVYYFSMATSFTKAALGAEGLGADVELVIGNGYTPGHAELGLQILRDSSEIKDLYYKKYGSS